MAGTGPIDFGEGEARETGYGTEFGGVDGLIQPEFVNGEEAHSELTEREKSNIAARKGMKPLSSHEAVTGEPDDPTLYDPATGRILDPADLEEVTGTGGQPSELKPK